MDDLISRQAAIDAFYNDPNVTFAQVDVLAILGELPSAEPLTGKCETCKRNADNGGFYDDGRTRCPIQEHYTLLKDGYCHLYEPRMRGED